MSHNQSTALEQLHAPNATINQEVKNLNLTNAISRGELILSLSTMLGCDYIFVNHKDVHELLHPTCIHNTIRELVDLLETSPHQSMVVSVNESASGTLAFTRYDFAWENRQVSKVSITPLLQSDQIDFMQMMFDCSTPYLH